MTLCKIAIKMAEYLVGSDYDPVGSDYDLVGTSLLVVGFGYDEAGSGYDPDLLWVVPWLFWASRGGQRHRQGSVFEKRSSSTASAVV